MSKLYEIYFSPTGGTARISKILASGLGAESEAVDLVKLVRGGGELPQFAAEDICLVSVPAFAGRVPMPCVQLLKELKGNGAKAVLNAVYGNRAIDDTLIELRDLMEEAGFVCAAAMETVAEHSMFRQFGAGRPDAEDEAELKAFAAQTAEILQKSELNGRLMVPGTYPHRERKPVSAIPSGGESCTGCGVCAEECPVHAIPKEDPASVDRTRCFGCMRCVFVCPSGARAIASEVREKMLPVMEANCSGRKTNKLYQERF